MSWGKRFRYLAWTLRRNRAEKELLDEIELHIDLETRENIEAGLSPSEARRRALKTFGDVGSAREGCREQWGFPRLETLWQDVRQAGRWLSRRPAFAALVILIIGLGVGANSAVFSVVRGVLLRPLPYPEDERLVWVWDVNPEQGLREASSPANVADWQDENRVFTAMGAWFGAPPLTLRGDFESQKVNGARVSAEFFPVLATQPFLGRFFTQQEVERQDALAVLSYGLWRQRFGADPEVVGNPIELDGDSYQVIGVMPAGFSIPSKEIGVWLPWNFSRLRELNLPRDHRGVRVLARLKPDVTLQQAQANMDAIMARLSEEYLDNLGWGVELVPLRQELVGGVQTPLLVLFGAVAFVLLIACANVANLLLARVLRRRQEVAVRSALGASKGRVLFQMLSECTLLALGGGALGLVLSRFFLRLILATAPADLPRADEVVIDGWVLAFTLGVSLLTSLVFGLIPALHATSGDVASGLKEGTQQGSPGRSHSRMRSLLVTIEVAAAVALLLTAGLLMRSFVRLINVEAGFNSENVLVLRVFPNPAKYRSTGSRLDYYERLIERVESLPGALSVGASAVLPMNALNHAPTIPYWRSDEVFPRSAPQATTISATAGYFEAMGMRLHKGRPFDSSDRGDSPPVVIVNQALAETVWPGEEAVGRQLVMNFERVGMRSFEVVGVLTDIRTDGLKQAVRPEIFRPYSQAASAAMNLVIRTAGTPLDLAGAAGSAVLEMDPTQPVHSVTTMGELLAESVATERFTMSLLTVMAGLSLLLAAFGIYAMLNYAVSERIHEIGVRVALGATRRDVVGGVLAQTGRLLLVGTPVGMLATFALARGLQSMLFQVSLVDGAAYLGAVWALILSALLASYFPAKRAAKVEPIQALRCE